MISTRSRDSLVGLRDWFVNGVGNAPGNDHFFGCIKSITHSDPTRAVRKRCLWLDARVARCEGRLEDAAKLCLAALHLSEFVYGKAINVEEEGEEIVTTFIRYSLCAYTTPVSLIYFYL